MKALLLVIALVPAWSIAQSITGKWMTIDDETGRQTSVVEIYQRGNQYYGKIIKIFPKDGDDIDPVCRECPEDDPRHGKKVIGMEIIRDLAVENEMYSNGDILDPKTGRIYKCKMWLEGEDLKVRGYWGPFYRTQTWKRS